MPTKAGTYTITVSSIDFNGNTISKTGKFTIYPNVPDPDTSDFLLLGPDIPFADNKGKNYIQLHLRDKYNNKYHSGHGIDFYKSFSLKIECPLSCIS